jgi:CRP-like cAMP-binding protein
MVSTDELAAVPLFASLSESDLHELVPWFEARTVSEGVELTGEGAAGYTFFILAEGSAVVMSGDATLAQVGPGDFFGEAAMLGGGRRNATVKTTSPSELLVMFGTEFRRLEQAQPSVVAQIQEVMRQRLGADSQSSRQPLL